MTTPVAIRRAPEPQAAARLIDWAAEEGWNPGLHDAEAFHTADPDGWWLAETKNGEPVGGLSLIHADDDAFAFLGLYIVRPDWRGRGIGLRVWTTALRASPAVCIGLDGVPAQQANYARSGFAPAFRSQRFRFDARHLPAIPVSSPAVLSTLSEDMVAEVAALDRAVAYPSQREAFLRVWLAPPGGAALGLQRSGQLTGYGVIRRCQAGHKVGPLIAENAGDARTLLAGLTEAVAAGETYLDVPHANAAALSLAETSGFEPVFETARMYRGTSPPALDLTRLWGVTTFELG